ncbi:MAG: hypothetical protein Q4C75_03305 [Bergeyella zoohelcum]|nr:hypothetical protein [Bergeyella zoohelcum]
MKQNISVQDFSSHLFWDVDLAEINIEKHRNFLIGRVIEYGFLKDWQLLKSLYGIEEIKKTSIELRSLDAVSLAFLSTIFQIPINQFRCYKHRQSVQNYWNS